MGIDWRSFAFVLRAGERVLELRDHGLMPSQRELAGLVDHTKAWTPRRKKLLAEMLGRPFEELVAVQDRQLGIRGPVTHPEGGLWASAIGDVDLAIGNEARGAILVENLETFRVLTVLASDGWIVIHVPGGPPPAECQLIERLANLGPELTFYPAFDLDPAGIRIACLVQERTGVEVDIRAMDPELLVATPHPLELNTWDYEQLARLNGNAGALDDLRVTIAAEGVKVEQETLHRQFLEIFRSADRAR